jgi:putative membrane protein
MNAFFAFLHHAAAFTLVSALVAEFVLLRQELSPRIARAVLRADLIFGISSGMLLAVGLARVVYFEKGAGYYFHSATFLAKLGIFAVVGLLSVYPTIVFLSWRKAVSANVLPDADPARLGLIRKLIHLELAGVLLILLFAALMARGVGFFG